MNPPATDERQGARRVAPLVFREMQLIDGKLCPKEDQLGQQGREGGHTMPTLSDRIAAYPVDQLRKFYAHLLHDTCETDTHVRGAARKHLTTFQVDGDSWGVPAIEDIVDRLCEKLAEKEQGREAELLAQIERLKTVLIAHNCGKPGCLCYQCCRELDEKERAFGGGGSCNVD